MVRIDLKGFIEEWKPFIKGIVSREMLPDWNKIWDNFFQEELQDKDLHPYRKLYEGVALAARMKGKMKKDLSKVMCFNYGEMGHFSSRCLMKKTRDDKKKKGKQVKQVIDVSTSVEIDALTRRLKEEEFVMISHFLQITIDEDGLYVDSGASKHMTGLQEVFETLSEWDSNLHMVLGDKSHNEIRGLGVASFRMESGQVMRAQDVLFVP